MRGEPCPVCGRRSKFGGRPVWCECSGWLDESMFASGPRVVTAPSDHSLCDHAEGICSRSPDGTYR